MKEGQPLVPSSYSGGDGDGGSGASAERTTLTFMKSQAHISWTLVIFVSLASLFFIIFYVIIANTVRAGNIFADVLAFTAYVGLGITSGVVFIWFSRHEGLNYQNSSPLIFVLCVVRCTEYLMMMLLHEDRSILSAIEALTNYWGFFFGLTVVNAIVREYFGDLQEPADPVPRLSQVQPSIRPTSSHRRSKGFAFSRSPDKGFTREDAQKIHDRLRAPSSPTAVPNVAPETYLKAIFASCLVMTFLVLLPPESAWVILFTTLSGGVTVGLGFLLIRLLISNILEVGQTSSIDGYLLFTKYHTNGLVVMSLLLPMAARVILDGIELISGVDVLHYEPDSSTDTFLTIAKEAITEVFPLFLHFYNIIRMKQGKPCNPESRLKWLIYAIILTLHFVCIAYIEESQQSLPFGVMLASASGYLAALDSVLLLLIIISPVTHLFFPVFNFGILRDAFHKFHFHRKLAYAATFFGIGHAFVHLITWIVNPYTRVNDEELYSMSRPFFYTGILIILGFLGAIYSGRNSNLKLSYHLPFSAAAFFAFAVHGSGGIIGPAVGDHIVVGVALVSILAISFFFAFYPSRGAVVDMQRSACVSGLNAKGKKTYFMLLVLENPTRQPVPPGSLFNIYDKRGGTYTHFHSHPFPVFSSSAKQLVFFIQCRNRKTKERPSFTRVLYKNVNNGSYKNLQLQGPLCGSLTVTSSFIQYLVGLPKHVDVYLCAANTGFSSIFSLLEQFRGNCHMYNVRSIFCTYYISEKKVRQHIHEYIDDLVEGWNASGEAPLTIVESLDLLESIKILSENSKTAIANSKRLDGETYILDLWNEKFRNTTGSDEIAKWVALGKDAVDNKHVTWDEDEWEEIDEDGTRKKGKGRDKKRKDGGGDGIVEETRSSEAPVVEESDPSQPTKLLFSCGVDVEYEFFSENWKIFNELTSPIYKVRSVLHSELTPKSYHSVHIQGPPVQPQSQDVSYQSGGV